MTWLFRRRPWPLLSTTLLQFIVALGSLLYLNQAQERPQFETAAGVFMKSLMKRNKRSRPVADASSRFGRAGSFSTSRKASYEWLDTL